MMITHYGLRWSAQAAWGGDGKILGLLEPFENPEMPTNEEYGRAEDYGDCIGIYCLYKGDELVYIGQTGLKEGDGCLYKRLKQHTEDDLKGKWDAFSWFGRKNNMGQAKVAECFFQLEAIAIEIASIKQKQKSGDFRGADEVLQVQDIHFLRMLRRSGQV